MKRALIPEIEDLLTRSQIGMIFFPVALSCVRLSSKEHSFRNVDTSGILLQPASLIVRLFLMMAATIKSP